MSTVSHSAAWTAADVSRFRATFQLIKRMLQKVHVVLTVTVSNF